MSTNSMHQLLSSWPYLAAAHAQVIRCEKIREWSLENLENIFKINSNILMYIKQKKILFMKYFIILNQRIHVENT